MDEQLYDDLVIDIRKVSLTLGGVLATEKCLVRKTGMKFHVDLHVLVNSAITVKEGHNIAHKLKEHLISELPQIADVLIHIEPNECDV